MVEEHILGPSAPVLLPAATRASAAAAEEADSRWRAPAPALELLPPSCLSLDLFEFELIDEVARKQNIGISAEFREGVETVSGRF